MDMQQQEDQKQKEIKLVEFQPGFRFYPTEEELVSFYLRKKLEENIREPNLLDRVIPVIHIYEFEPWLLPSSSNLYLSFSFFFSFNWHIVHIYLYFLK